MILNNILIYLNKVLWFFFSSCCSVTQLCPTLCDHMDLTHQASLSFTISQSLLKLMSIESMMPSNHLILCCPLLLLPSIFPIIRVFSSRLFYLWLFPYPNFLFCTFVLTVCFFIKLVCQWQLSQENRIHPRYPMIVFTNKGSYVYKIVGKVVEVKVKERSI